MLSCNSGSVQKMITRSETSTTQSGSAMNRSGSAAQSGSAMSRSGSLRTYLTFRISSSDISKPPRRQKTKLASCDELFFFFFFFFFLIIIMAMISVQSLKSTLSQNCNINVPALCFLCRFTQQGQRHQSVQADNNGTAAAAPQTFRRNHKCHRRRLRVSKLPLFLVLSISFLTSESSGVVSYTGSGVLISVPSLHIVPNLGWARSGIAKVRAKSLVTAGIRLMCAGLAFARASGTAGHQVEKKFLRTCLSKKTTSASGENRTHGFHVQLCYFTANNAAVARIDSLSAAIQTWGKLPTPV